MANPYRFADVFNAFLFEGKQIIDSQQLREIDSVEDYIPKEKKEQSKKNQSKKNQENYFERLRDLLKEAVIKQDDNLTYVLLGLENQSDVHYAMPVRNMLYDALAYETQIRQINDRSYQETGKRPYVKGITPGSRLNPVITLTLYWGNDSWDAPQRLSEMLKPHHEKLDPYIADYDIHLFSIIDETSTGIINHLAIPELRNVFELLHVRNDRQIFREKLRDESKYSAVSIEDARILEKFAAVKIKQTEGDVVNMCRAVEELIAEGRAEGIKEGRENTLEEALKQFVRLLKLDNQSTDAIWQKIQKMDIYRDVSYEKIDRIVQSGS